MSLFASILLALLASERASAQVCEPDPTVERLVVVLWERRQSNSLAPDGDWADKSFRDQQASMHTALLHLLFEGGADGGPVIGRGDVVAVIPEGLDKGKGEAAALNNAVLNATRQPKERQPVIEDAFTAALGRGPLDQHGSGAVRAVRYTFGDDDADRQRLGDAIWNCIACPMIQGWACTGCEACMSASDEEACRLQDPQGTDRTGVHQRSVSNPWLLTNRVLGDELAALGADTPYPPYSCDEPREVWLVWAQAGDRSYAVSHPYGRIELDFVDALGDYYRGLEAGYWLQVYHPPGLAPELRRQLEVFRVHRKAHQQMVMTREGQSRALSFWRNAAGGQAEIDSVGSFRWSVMGDLSIGQFEPPAWQLELPSGYGVHSAAATLVSTSGDQRVETPITLDHVPGGSTLHIADPAAFKRALLDHHRELFGGGLLTGSGHLQPRLEVDLRAVPPGTNQAEHALFDPLPLTEPLPVAQPPKLSVLLHPPRARFWAGLLVLLGSLVILAGTLTALLRLRRPLNVKLARHGVRTIDLQQHRDEESIQRAFRLSIADGWLSLLPFRSPMRVEVRLEGMMQPDVPVDPRHAARFQRLLPSRGWSLQGDALICDLELPRPRALARSPIRVETLHKAIDYSRVQRSQLALTYALRVTINEPGGRYRRIEDEQGPGQLIVKQISIENAPGPPRPRASLDLFAHITARFLELNLTGEDAQPWERNIYTHPPLGYLVLANPAEGLGYLPSDFTWRLREHRLRVTPAGQPQLPSTPAQLVLRGYSSDEGTTVAAGKEIEIGVELALSPTILERDQMRWEVHLELESEYEVRSTGQVIPLPPIPRLFQMHIGGRPRTLCLDFGTSSFRLLLQERVQQRWAFLRTTTVKPFEDLPSQVVIKRDGTVLFGQHALRAIRRGTPHEAAYESLKSLLLGTRIGVADAVVVEHLQRVVHALLDETYAKQVGTEKPFMAVFLDTAGGTRQDRLSPGACHEVIALLPNDARAEYVNALTEALHSYPGTAGCPGFTRPPILLREAEAVALWFSAMVWDAPIPQLPHPKPRLRLLVIDVGGGTTDAALVDVERDPNRDAVGDAGRSHKLTVIATGGAPVAGRAVDEALFDTLCHLGLPEYGLSWEALTRDQRWLLRDQIDRKKRAMAQAELASRATAPADRAPAPPSGDFQLMVPTGAEEVPVTQPFAAMLATTPTGPDGSRLPYATTLDAICLEPLYGVLGRRPRVPGQARDLSDVDLVVLTGRGSLAPGLLTRFEDLLEQRLGLPPSPAGAPGRVYRPKPAFLKAAVSIGARYYAHSMFGAFTPSDRTFPDRLLLVFREPGRHGAKAVELLPPGRPFRGGPIDTRDEPVRVPRWETARLVRTWMVPGQPGRTTQPWELDQEALGAILKGDQPKQVAYARPYVDVPFDERHIRFHEQPGGRQSAWLHVMISYDDPDRIELGSTGRTS